MTLVAINSSAPYCGVMLKNQELRLRYINRYRISFIIYSVCMSLVFISCATSSKKDLEIEYIQLQGKWEGRDVSGKVGTVIFYEDRHY